jgi:hypothetical protein
MSDLQFVDENGRPLSTTDNSDHPILRFFDEDRRKAVTKEYAGDWYVQADEGVTPHVQVEEGGETTYTRLEPAGSEDRYQLPDSDPGKAGLLTFYDKVDEGEYEPLSPDLYVRPGSLTEDEYSRLLRRIGELAIATESAKQAPIPDSAVGGISDEEADIPDEPQFRAAKLYLRLAEVTKEQWPLIAENPSQEIGYRTRSVDVRRSRSSSQVAKRRAQRPQKRRVSVRTSTQVTETPSNQALAFTLRRILVQQAPFLVDQLSNVSANTTHWDAPLYDIIEEERQQLEEKKKKLKRAAETLTERIEEVKSWAQECAQNPFVAQYGLRPKLPKRPTRRLMRSTTYGPLYQALLDYLDHQTSSLDPRQEGLVDIVRNRGVLRTQDLYEKWVFLEIYGQLILSFGFEPVEEEDPFSELDSASGVLQLPDGASYSLSRLLSDKGRDWKIDVELSYDRDISNPPNWPSSILNPDVHLDVHLDRISKFRSIDSPVKSTGQSFQFAFDAKYRRYRSMKDSSYREEDVQEYNGSHYFLDLLGTAREKYFKGLDTDAAFVIHSDPRWSSYWGEKPVEDLPRGERQPDAEGFVNHRFGSIFSTPDEEGEGIQRIERLLRCVLMYHCKIDEYCWTCGERVAPKQVTKGGEESQKGKGLLYECCDRFWIVTNCTGDEKGNKHRLVKFKDSFHATGEGEDVEFSCICPQCGDLFGDEQEWGYQKVECSRCNGKGVIPRWNHIADGRCLKSKGGCGGDGYVKKKQPVGTSEVDIEGRLRSANA